MFNKFNFLLFIIAILVMVGNNYVSAEGLIIPSGDKISVDANTINVDGSVEINGELNLDSGNIQLDGDWTSNGYFNPSIAGEVTLNSTTQAQLVTLGVNVFHILNIGNTSQSGVTFTDALTCDTLNAGPGVQQLLFANSSTQNVNTSFNVNGSSGNLIKLASNLPLGTPGLSWNLNTPSTIVHYVDVHNSSVVNGNTITACNSVGVLAGNTNWFFVSCSGGNAAPIADAGPDDSEVIGTPLQLNGSGSWDANGDQLVIFDWSLDSQPSGSTAGLVLNPSNPAHPILTMDESGDYTVTLRVTDDNASALTSDPDTVVLSTINSAPTAEAGPPQSVFVGDLVTLDGHDSYDPDEDPLTFSWSFISKPVDSTTTLDDDTSIYPTFTVDEPGDYKLSLTVNDGALNSESDEVVISTENSIPEADAGPDQSVFVGDNVILDGSGSDDADGDSLTYSWALLQKPAGSAANLVDSTAINPTFVADVSGTYIVDLIVNDGTEDSAVDSVEISTINVPPVSDAGNNDSVLTGEIVVLDGSGSSDADGDSLTYSWSLQAPQGSATILANPNTANPSFTPDVAGMYEVSLVVNDGIVDSEPNKVTITAITHETATIITIEETIDQINSLEDDLPNVEEPIFNNPNNQKALTSKFSTVIDKLQNGDLQDALKKLENDILRKTDGCANQGSPDKNDWVKSCDAQALIYPLIMEAIQLLSQP